MKEVYDFLYYTYYSLVSPKFDLREEGANSAITILVTSIIISVYMFLNIATKRTYYIPSLEGLGIFFFGIIVWYLNRLYFIKSNRFIRVVEKYQHKSQILPIIIGIILLVLPFTLFAISGVKMGNYIRSLN